MSGDWREQAQALADQADGLEPGEGKVRLLEEAVRLADTHGDTKLGYALRDALIGAVGLALALASKTMALTPVAVLGLVTAVRVLRQHGGELFVHGGDDGGAHRAILHRPKKKAARRPLSRDRAGALTP